MDWFLTYYVESYKAKDLIDSLVVQLCDVRLLRPLFRSSNALAVECLVFDFQTFEVQRWSHDGNLLESRSMDSLARE